MKARFSKAQLHLSLPHVQLGKSRRLALPDLSRIQGPLLAG